jgi:RNA polymerase sigma-70 factor (ECF subfamily)
LLERAKLENTEQITSVSHTASDSELIDRILQGEKNLYEKIMRKYNQRLFRIGRAIIRDEDDIEDVLQETYVKAYENLGRFANRSAFSTWLTRICINEAISKKNKGKRTVSMYILNEENTINKGYINHNNMISDTRNPEEETINNELKNSLEKVIDSLPEKYRLVYVMREIEGLNILETADCLAISESNVKVRLNRAKEMLRDNLTNIYKESDMFQFLGTRCDRIVNRVMNRIEKI